MEKHNLLATYTIAASAAISGMSFNQWLALGGFTLGICTFTVNWYYKHQELKFKHLALKPTKTDSDNA